MRKPRWLGGGNAATLKKLTNLSLISGNSPKFEIQPYYSEDGKVPFAQWQDGVRDHKVKTAVARRLYRVAQGNFGDCKPCRDGVWELRIDLRPGYRVYSARDGHAVVLLLCGGDKRSQQADIAQACAYWQDWQARHSAPGDTP